MNHPNESQRVRATVVVNSDSIDASIHDRAEHDLELFARLDERHQNALAADAWTIGLRALRNAHADAREANLEGIGKALLSDVSQRLNEHVESSRTRVEDVLKTYFDPKEGRLTERLNAFLADGGVLKRQLDEFLSRTNQTLAETLARQVGESSALSKMLSPTETEGLVKVLERQLATVMSAEHDELTKALDPLAEGGAVARFLGSLREEMAKAGENQNQQIATALAALDANDEDSLLSRLIRETNETQQSLLKAVNPESAGSPLAVLKSSIESQLKSLGESQAERDRTREQRQVEFEKTIRETLARFETKRSETLRSTHGGLDFEDAAIAFVASSVVGAPVAIEATGSTPGLGRCKHGDAVMRFSAESAFCGSAVVFEAKREKGITESKAVEALDEARKNRDACAGVFILARSHANDAFRRISRHGTNVLVIWDENDSRTDPYLEAAIYLGMMLASRRQSDVDQGDIDALRDVESRIDAEIVRLATLEEHSAKIRTSIDAIDDEVRKARGALGRLKMSAQSTLRALRVEVRDEDAERATPIAAPPQERPAA